MSDVKEVRPKVFADHGGEEWRCIEGKLQVRIHEDSEEFDGATETPPLESSFGEGHEMTQEQWLVFIRKSVPRALPAVEAAMAHPMTADEGQADDEAIPWPPPDARRKAIRREVLQNGVRVARLAVNAADRKYNDAVQALDEFEVSELGLPSILRSTAA